MYNNIDSRRKKILDELDETGKVYVSSLAKKFSVSLETIRRDLDYLEKNNKLKKVYGAAVKKKDIILELAYENRIEHNVDAREAIAKKASEFIEDYDVIAIQGGVTTSYMVPYLKGKKGLIIVTNSLPILFDLTNLKKNQLFDGEIIYIGGKVNANSMVTTGHIAEETIKSFNFNKLFFSCAGVSEDKVTTYSENNVNISKALIENSIEIFLLADSSKININHIYLLSDFSNINYIISDIEVPKKFNNKLKENKVQWIKA